MLSADQLLNGRYRIREKCGKGGMGTVYRAEDERLAMTVAIKECAFERPDLRRLFTQEARLVARLRHRTIARVIDHFEEGDCQYLVMDFVPGETLADLPQSALTLPRILAWGDALLDALEFLHGQEPPVVHRDIKPQNIKLWADDTPVLLDFGLAKGGAPAAHTIPSRSVVGYTPHYAAIEQMLGSGTDARSDVYSLSATMYRLLTGTVPPDAMTRVEATNDGNPDPLRPIVDIAPPVPAALAAIVEKGMATAKRARFASAREMRESWTACRGVHAADTVLDPTVVAAPAAARSHVEASDFAELPTRRPAASPPVETTRPLTPLVATAAAGAPVAAVAAEPVATSGSRMRTRVVVAAIVGVLAVLAVGALAYGVHAWTEFRKAPIASIEPGPNPPKPDPPRADTTPAPTPTLEPGPPAAAPVSTVPGRIGRIVEWEAETPDLVAGESTVLRWRVTDAPDLEITPDIGAVDPAEGSIKVTPQATTNYRLRSPSQPRLEPQSITVSVAPPLRTLVGFDKAGWVLKSVAPVGSDWLAVELEAHPTEHHLGQVVVVPIRDLTAPTRVLATSRGTALTGIAGTPDGRLITLGRAYAADGRNLGRFDAWTAHLRFTRDGAVAVTSGPRPFDGKGLAVAMRDGRTGRLHWYDSLEHGVKDIAVKSDAKLVAVATWHNGPSGLVINDGNTGMPLRKLPFSPTAVAWLAGDELAVAEPGKGITILNASTGEVRAKLNYLKEPIAASADGRWFAAHQLDGSGVITGFSTGPTHQLPVESASLSFSADGRFVVAQSVKAVDVFKTADGSRVTGLRW